MVAEVLDVVLNGEPLVAVLPVEVHAIAELHADPNEVFGLDFDDIADEVVVNPQVHRAKQSIRVLRLARGEFQNREALIVLQQDRGKHR